MAISIVDNRVTRKVFKPSTGRLEPKIPGFVEFAALNFVYQLAVPTNESSGYYGEAAGMVGHEFDDSGLIVYVVVGSETRPDAANTILALAGGFHLMLDDYPLLETTFPIPGMYQAAVAAVQPYLYNLFYFNNLWIPIVEDNRIQPEIHGANVFGGADANVKIEVEVGYIKTK